MERNILAVHILPKLPVKSLFRFKSVCKEWLELISDDPAFHREHYRNSMANPCLAYVATPWPTIRFLQTTIGTDIYDDDDVPPDLSLGFLKRSNRQILASCSGLLCVKAGKSAFVCNPLTREWSLIPKPMQRWFTTQTFGLAFDPLHSPQAYKLVAFDQRVNRRDSDGSEVLRFSVFSSNTGMWITSKESIVVPEYMTYSVKNSVFASGILYWFLEAALVWFDPHKDLSGILLTPPIIDELPILREVLGVWEDRLSYSRILDTNVLEAWIMIEFQWTRICQVSLDSSLIFHGVPSRNPCVSIFPYQGGDLVYFYRTVLDRERTEGVIFQNAQTGELTKSHRCQGIIPSYYLPYSYSLCHVPKLSKHAS